MKRHALNFTAGFLATFLFHQGTVGLLYLLGIVPNPPFNLTETAPFGVPAVISSAFFGGLWGVLIALLVRAQPNFQFWLKWILFGAVGPTAVAFLIVFPLKGIEFKPFMIPFGLLFNGMWGLGTGLFSKLFGAAKT